ncbi:MAG TPA: hypothetical protein VK400_06145 [Pyrinomonadaceae bacterium]|nr:hypothetical protein [Pyrinomonadaceae bacterium]
MCQPGIKSLTMLFSSTGIESETLDSSNSAEPPGAAQNRQNPDDLSGRFTGEQRAK